MWLRHVDVLQKSVFTLGSSPIIRLMEQNVPTSRIMMMMMMIIIIQFNSIFYLLASLLNSQNVNNNNNNSTEFFIYLHPY
jgi:hypothetical protein